MAHIEALNEFLFGFGVYFGKKIFFFFVFWFFPSALWWHYKGLIFYCDFFFLCILHKTCEKCK